MSDHMSDEMSNQITHSRQRINVTAKHNEESGGQYEKQIEANFIQSKSSLKSVKDLTIYGVLPKFATLYQRTGDSFRCLLSGEEIPFDQINDDYCDCMDGSDEPSTNACPHNKLVSMSIKAIKNDLRHSKHF